MNSLKKRLYIFGVSTTAKAIYTFVNNYKLFEVKGFVIDKAYKTSDEFCGLPVIGIEEGKHIENFDNRSDYLFIAIQWNKLNSDRRNMYLRFKELGYRFANIISPHAVIHGEFRGENCWVSDFAVVDTNSIIGTNVFIKTKAFIGNDCIIGDHCFIGASSFVAGDCVIGDQTFIGVRATVFDNVKIGEKCIIGACTTINRNVENYTLVKTSSKQEVKVYDEASVEAKLNFQKNIR